MKQVHFEHVDNIVVGQKQNTVAPYNKWAGSRARVFG